MTDNNRAEGRVCRYCGMDTGYLFRMDSDMTWEHADADDCIAALRADRDRLAACMRRAGLVFFLREGTPEQVDEHMENVARSHTEANARLAAQLAEAQRDAERYRWLRDEGFISPTRTTYMRIGFGYHAAEVDAAVDAKRAREVGGTDIGDWLASRAECLTCGHKWVAVHPLGADDLECPQCHGTDTVRDAGEKSDD